MYYSTVEIAKEKYKCDSCGREIHIGQKYIKTMYDNKYHLYCPMGIGEMNNADRNSRDRVVLQTGKHCAGNTKGGSIKRKANMVKFAAVA